MKYTAHFYQLNYNFSPEYAAANHGGKASENNPKFNWEDELEITANIENLEVIENGTYSIQGEKDGTPFSIDIPNMLCFHFIDAEGEITKMACSHSLIGDYSIEEGAKHSVLSVYMDEQEPLTNPIAGIYIALQEFPKELID